MTAETTRPFRRQCRDCEYWDCLGAKFRETAAVGDCHGPRGDRFAPPAEHCCDGFLPDSSRWPEESEPSQ